MPAQMIAHEGRDEIIAVIIAALATQLERNARFLACSLQQLRAKLLGQERIGVADIDQQLGKSCAVLDEGDRIMLAPGVLVASEIAAERLDAPRYARRRDDR